MRIKQSIVLPIFHDFANPFEALLGEIRAIGYPAVELWDRGGVKDYVGLIESARRHGLFVASMAGHGALSNGLNKYENHDRIEAELRESIGIAARYGIPGLICFSGNRNPGQSDYEGMVASAKGLRRIARYAEEKGVNLNVELLNSRMDHAHYQADRSDWGVAMCEMVGSPRVKLLFDIYHVQIMEGDIIRTIRKSIGHIGHFHTAGNPGRNDLDDCQELNYRGICKAIAETGYELYVGHEFRPKADMLKSMREAFAVCDQD